MGFEAKLSELLYKYYFDDLSYGEEVAVSRLREAINSGEYTDAFVEMVQDGVRQANELTGFTVTNDPEDRGGLH